MADHDANALEGRNAAALAGGRSTRSSLTSGVENDYDSDDESQDSDGPAVAKSIEAWLRSGGVGPGSLPRASIGKGGAEVRDGCADGFFAI